MSAHAPKPPQKQASLKRDYVTTADGWVAGQWRAKGSRVSLSERQAQYENVTLAVAAPAKKSAAKT